MLDGIDPSATQPFYRVDLDTGLVTGSGDPVPIPGWNEKNKTIIVESLFGEVQIPDERPALQFSGEDLVVTTLTTPSGGLSDPRNNLYLYPTQPRKATSVYLQILQQGEVGFNLESVVYDDGLRDPFDDRGPDLTLLAPFSTELETFLGTNAQRQTGRAVLGGDIRVECGGRLIADGLLSLGLLGGDIFVRGHSLELANSQNESNFFSAQPAGRITLLAEDALTINDDIYADGGEITVISRKGTINAPVTLHARGLNGVQKYPEGTDGGKIRVFSRNPVTLARAVASGGNGVDGNYRGGDGGQITVITAGGDLDVNGGTGTPNGQNGTVRILSDSLIVSAPDNLTFNTDTGLYDGYDLPGWDPISQSLTLTLFQIDEGATMNIEGAGSFSCSSTSTTDISGTLRFPGTDESESAPASVGGAIYLSAEESIAVGQTGTIESPGGNGAESAGTGGNLQLFSPLVQVDGLLSTVGGRGSNVPSGDGGICFVEGVVSLTLGGTIDCSGQGGFNLAGDGGLVGLVTAGALDVLGKVVCVGGDSSAGGGDGGEVGMSVGGITTLGQVECDGGDSTLTPGSGGSFYLDGSDSITVNGPVTVNAGHSDTSKAGNGGIVDISGSATVSIDGSISANGTRQGQGGSIIVQGDGGVTNNGTTTATPGGTVQVTP